MFGQLLDVLAPGACPFTTDQWDGYEAARARVLAVIEKNRVENVAISTGDIHSSWGNDITLNPFDPAHYDPVTDRGSLAVELVTPAVTSPGVENPLEAFGLAQALRATHPHIRYVDLNRRGTPRSHL